MQERRVSPYVRLSEVTLLLAILVSVVSSCQRSQPMVEPTAEQLTLALESARNGEMPAILSWEMEESERGVRYEELEPGDGTSPFYGSTVRMHYYVWLPDGTLVDSTRPDGISTPFEFEPGGRRTIVGWDELVLQLKAGSEAVAVIPWELAYGRNGRRDIPGRTDLVVYVSILQVR